MPKEVQIRINPEDYGDERIWKLQAARKAGLKVEDIKSIELLRRSVDSRKKAVFVLKLRLSLKGEEADVLDSSLGVALKDVSDAPEVHIVGLGPAGLFAGLQLIEKGYKPIILERGKDVRARRRDLAALSKHGIVNPESNYCFGEGGAGTFSDGKLYTRSTKRGDTRRVLDTLVQFGAVKDILIDSHPHIGTNKLPRIIQSMREAIVEAGGEVLFDTRLSGIKKDSTGVQAIQLNDKEWISCNSLILATGHSARDVFRLLHHADILIEAKPFALGVRVEHPQHLIDKIQYHIKGDRNFHLPAASYSLVQQVEGKGVYSFCMCPGGIICPAATSPGELVVNGWSPSKRNSPYANSGMVVEISLKDMVNPIENPLAGIEFQSRVEKLASRLGGGKQVAPAQGLEDFVKGKYSKNIPKSSYIPGLNSAKLDEVLPDFVYERLQGGFRAFGRRLKGFLSNEAVAVATESRTSSPVRIPRDRESLMHPQVNGLFPCGEGAGYAGGIMSAAIDGQKCARAAVSFLEKVKN
ncbi:MAG: FAD-dependent monooxygenase [Bacteroidia bacterium]|nr:FAD-dependent monooxygenase [Bacteroidia bacterium]